MPLAWWHFANCPFAFLTLRLPKHLGSKCLCQIHISFGLSRVQICDLEWNLKATGSSVCRLTWHSSVSLGANAVWRFIYWFKKTTKKFWFRIGCTNKDYIQSLELIKDLLILFWLKLCWIIFLTWLKKSVIKILTSDYTLDWDEFLLEKQTGWLTGYPVCIYVYT